MPTPVILDTDIGTDIDDTWALALLLKCFELDLKLVVTDSGNTTYRGAVTAKFLEAAGRTDIPIGIGIHEGDEIGPQESWLDGYQLDEYPGIIHEDGVKAMINTIMASPEMITLLCIGPAPNIQAALEFEPRITQKARIVGMYGSLRMGYEGSDEIINEYNVRAAPQACRVMFESFPQVTITPLDTCGTVKLSGAKYQAVRDCDDPLIRALIENYRVWANHVEWGNYNPDNASSTLFDTVAVYLATNEEFLTMEEVGIYVTNDGYTLIDERAKPIRCATQWNDQSAFEDWLIKRLTA